MQPDFEAPRLQGPLEDPERLALIRTSLQINDIRGTDGKVCGSDVEGRLLYAITWLPGYYGHQRDQCESIDPAFAPTGIMAGVGQCKDKIIWNNCDPIDTVSGEEHTRARPPVYEQHMTLWVEIHGDNITADRATRVWTVRIRIRGTANELQFGDPASGIESTYFEKTRFKRIQFRRLYPVKLPDILFPWLGRGRWGPGTLARQNNGSVVFYQFSRKIKHRGLTPALRVFPDKPVL
ncbi:hypothetical protein B0H19DRAFT_1147170 [Mycena capillaripes]|nr:hypothetical protein B0H19DRAFT_1147170 [Mycena capillaripes]